MKRILIFLLLCAWMPAMAQRPSVREVFKAMPDSLLPYLTTNNRLDLIDFIDANMKSVVTNLLEGETQMTTLTDDSLSLQLNSLVVLDLCLEPVDTGMVVCLRKTYRISDRQEQTSEERYTLDWRPISKRTAQSTLLCRDEEINIHAKIVQQSVLGRLLESRYTFPLFHQE